MSKFSKTLYFSLGRWGSQERMAGVAFCFFLIPAFLVHNCLPQCLGYNTVFFKKIFISYANWLYIYLCDRGFFICLFCFVYKAPCIISSLNLQALYWKVESFSSVQFSSVQSLSRIQLFVTPWIAARQASLSITNSRSSLRLMSIESVMPSRHLILCRPLLLLPPIH